MKLPRLPALLLAATVAHAASVEAFLSRHAPFDAAPPLLTHPAWQDALRGAKITASGHDDEQRPEFVHDGVHTDTVMFWTSKTYPSWVRLDLPESREIAQVGFRVRAPSTRLFHFVLEASADGTAWQTLRDARTEPAAIPATGLNVVLSAPLRVQALRLTFTGATAQGDGPYVCEIAAYSRAVSRALDGAVGDLLHLYGPDNVPLAPGVADWHAAAWRGERVHGQFVAWTLPARTGLRAEVSPLRSSSGATLHGTARFVRQVLADSVPVGDVLDPAPRVDMPPGSFRTVWLTVETPRDASPGVYTGTLILCADDTEPKIFPLTLEVLPAALPAPADWKFHLDVWQHPWSIARMHGVEPWSEGHFQVMRPYMVELARAGQKVITATITPRPWGSRDYDDYGTMVTHTRHPDGSWTFDYSVFDRYVEFAIGCGIGAQINCYALLTWSGRLEYTDAATGDTRWAMGEPGSPEFADYWGPFLRDFERHLAARGWLERTRLAVDEPPAALMHAMKDLLRTHAPRLKLALAGNHEPSHYTGLDLADFTIILDHVSGDLLRDIARRRAEGRVTTFYVCLDPKRPNTFVRSPPAEAVWLGYYTSVNDYDGMLRWAFTTWPEIPQHETLYSGHPYRRDLPPGDSFLCYPGPRLSIHWEMLRDGIEEFEKLRVLRARHGGALPPEVTTALENFRDSKQLGADDQVRRHVAAMRAAVESAARNLR